MDLKNELEKSIPANMKLTENEKANIRNRVRKSHTSIFHLKPLFLSVLSIMIAVVLMLPSIQSNVKEENPSDRMSINDTNHSFTPISEKQKQQYYEEYKKIVEQAMEQKVGIGISVPPMNEFKESDWIAPEDYEKMVQNIVEQHLSTEHEKKDSMSSYLKPAVTSMNGETTKSTYVYFPGILKEITVKADFDTQYSSEPNRQLFVAVDNISSQLADSRGKWEQTYSHASLVDGSRTYSIQIEGIFEYNNLSFEKVFTIEFSCDEFGNIY